MAHRWPLYPLEDLFDLFPKATGQCDAESEAGHTLGESAEVLKQLECESLLFSTCEREIVALACLLYGFVYPYSGRSRSDGTDFVAAFSDVRSLKQLQNAL